MNAKFKRYSRGKLQTPNWAGAYPIPSCTPVIPQLQALSRNSPSCFTTPLKT